MEHVKHVGINFLLSVTV